MYGLDVQILKKSHGRQGESSCHLRFDGLAPVSFAFEEGSGSFSVCNDLSTETIANVTKLRLAVMSAQGRIQSSGRLEYGRGLLRLREPGRHAPRHALNMPVLLLCYEELRISLEDVTSEVHAKSLSSYNSIVDISVSIYDMSVVPEERLYVTATGRIAVRPSARGGESPPPPPQEDRENLENLSVETEEEEQEEVGDGNAQEQQEEEDEELQELARIFGTKLRSPRKKQVSPQRRETKLTEAPRDELNTSLSIEDVIEQMRIEQESAEAEQHQHALKASQAAKAEKAARAAERALLSRPPHPPESVAHDALAKGNGLAKKETLKKRRASLAAPRSLYKREETGQVIKRPYLKKGAAEERRLRHAAHGKLLRAELGLAAGGKKRAPLAARGSPMKHVERGSHADGNKLTLGTKTTRAIGRERRRVTGVADGSGQGPAVQGSYRESMDRKQMERERRYHSRIQAAHANATASATVAWRFGHTARVDVRDNRHLVAGEGVRASRRAKEADGMISTGAGRKRFYTEQEDIPWRPPLSAKEPDPIIFTA